MPVFTFEKISPPMRRVNASSSSAAEKPRGVLPRLLDRFTETRAKRKVSADKTAQKQPRKSSK